MMVNLVLYSHFSMHIVSWKREHMSTKSSVLILKVHAKQEYLSLMGTKVFKTM